MPLPRPCPVQDAQWWLPDANVSDVLIHISTIKEGMHGCSLCADCELQCGMLEADFVSAMLRCSCMACSGWTSRRVTHLCAAVPYLRSVPQDELRRKLAAVQEARSRFFFRSQLTEPPNAVNTMTSGICRRHRYVGLSQHQ